MKIKTVCASLILTCIIFTNPPATAQYLSQTWFCTTFYRQRVKEVKEKFKGQIRGMLRNCQSNPSSLSDSHCGKICYSWTAGGANIYELSDNSSQPAVLYNNAKDLLENAQTSLNKSNGVLKRRQQYQYDLNNEIQNARNAEQEYTRRLKQKESNLTAKQSELKKIKDKNNYLVNQINSLKQSRIKLNNTIDTINSDDENIENEIQNYVQKNKKTLTNISTTKINISNILNSKYKLYNNTSSICPTLIDKTNTLKNILENEITLNKKIKKTKKENGATTNSLNTIKENINKIIIQLKSCNKTTNTYRDKNKIIQQLNSKLTKKNLQLKHTKSNEILIIKKLDNKGKNLINSIKQLALYNSIDTQIKNEFQNNYKPGVLNEYIKKTLKNINIIKIKLDKNKN